MENIGDYIYIIVMIVAFIISAINKANKSKNSKPIPPHSTPNAKEHEEPELSIEDLRNLFNSPKVQKSQERPTQIQKQNKASLEKVDLSEKKRKEVPNEAFLHDHEHQQSHEHILHEEFDLRKAVIYSEIMKRPYS